MKKEALLAFFTCVMLLGSSVASGHNHDDHHHHHHGGHYGGDGDGHHRSREQQRHGHKDKNNYNTQKHGECECVVEKDGVNVTKVVNARRWWCEESEHCEWKFVEVGGKCKYDEHGAVDHGETLNWAKRNICKMTFLEDSCVANTFCKWVKHDTTAAPSLQPSSSPSSSTSSPSASPTTNDEFLEENENDIIDSSSILAKSTFLSEECDVVAHEFAEEQDSKFEGMIENDGYCIVFEAKLNQIIKYKIVDGEATVISLDDDLLNDSDAQQQQVVNSQIGTSNDKFLLVKPALGSYSIHVSSIPSSMREEIEKEQEQDQEQQEAILRSRFIGFAVFTAAGVFFILSCCIAAWSKTINAVHISQKEEGVPAKVVIVEEHKSLSVV